MTPTISTCHGRTDAVTYLEDGYLPTVGGIERKIDVMESVEGVAQFFVKLYDDLLGHAGYRKPKSFMPKASLSKSISSREPLPATTVTAFSPVRMPSASVLPIRTTRICASASIRGEGEIYFSNDRF